MLLLERKIKLIETSVSRDGEQIELKLSSPWTSTHQENIHLNNMHQIKLNELQVQNQKHSKNYLKLNQNPPPF